MKQGNWLAFCVTLLGISLIIMGTAIRQTNTKLNELEHKVTTYISSHE